MSQTVTITAVGSSLAESADGHGGFVQLSTDTQRSAVSGYQRALASQRLLKLSKDEPAAALLGALCAVLFRYTQQEIIDLDVYEWQRNSARPAAGLLRCPVGAETPLSEAVACAAAGLIALRVQDTTEQNRDSESNIAVSLLTGGTAWANGLDDADTHDVHFVVHAQPFALDVAYNARLFEAGTIERLADALVRVFEVALAQPSMPIARLPVLSAADLHAITAEWDSGHAKYAAEPVHRVFERWAAQQPDAPAVSFETQTLTYGELEERSNQLAHHLLACGVTPGDAVAVCVLPALDIVVAFLTIWKAGAVYVPLDPTHPQALIAGILGEVQPRVVLTQSTLRSLTSAAGCAQFCFDTDWHLTEALPVVAPQVHTTLEDPVYVLYTSGTTGRPKGVDARHANLAHYMHVARQKYGFGPDDAFCSLARYTFSISLFELVLPLCCGASLRLLARDDVLAPNRLARWLEHVTVLHAGPSLLGNLFRHMRSGDSTRQTFPRMRHASSGGDLVPPTLLEEMKHVFGNAELFVIYGSTEISCMGCTYPIRRDGNVTRTFVGKPFADVAVRVADPAENILPLGAVGEICFAGKGVVRGYLQRPELTAEKFVECEGRVFYRTGDLGRLHPDGNIEILGRRDYQVQLRGIRVELPGIENTVRAIGLAEQCAVVVKKLHEQDVRLVAFVVKPREATIAAFRHALAAHLPDYMLPQAMVAIDALPVTRNGKLDRSALQELPWESSQNHAPRAGPRTTIEHRFAEAFAKTLGMAEIGIDDDFFDCGGHSLLAVMMLQELEKTLGLSLAPGLLFEHPTVRALAAEAQNSIARVALPIQLSNASDKPPLFVLLGVQLYRPLARRLEGHYSVYSVYAKSELVMLESPDKAPGVFELASDYVEMIRRQQPNGPYRIAGISFGGIVAYEVAQQLRAAGAQVAFVGLIDAILPENGMRFRIGQLSRALSLPWRELVHVAIGRLQRRMAALRGARPKSEFSFYVSQEKVAAIDDLRQAGYARAAELYIARIKPFEGNVELIVAGRRLASDPLQPSDCGWGRHVASVRPHIIDAEHIGLVEEPNVSSVAEIFLQSLRRSERQSSFEPAASESPPEAWTCSAAS